MTRRKFTPSVHLCGMMRLENGDETYTDESPEFWTVYLRKDFEDGEFDLDREKDFDDLESAEGYARELAREFQCEWETY